MARKHPELLAERNRGVSEYTDPREKTIAYLLLVSFLAIYVLVALDSGRFQWTHVPLGVQIAGWVAMLACLGMVTWVMDANAFASAEVRIQGERGQRVITTGPYRLVRHPMYLAVVVVGVAFPLAMGSLVALLGQCCA